MTAFGQYSQDNTASGMKQRDYKDVTDIVATQNGGFFSAVRRLTPVECARLQGFPDDYLNIIYNGKPACDSPKYRALGNSMSTTVMGWIGTRIEMAIGYKDFQK